MAIYETTADRFRPITDTSFEANGGGWRGDIQRLLRAQVEVISPGTLIIAEEFCEWEDSRRRIDLLGLDKDGKSDRLRIETIGRRRGHGAGLPT